MFYEYKCPRHGAFLHSERDSNQRCPLCDSLSTRRFSFFKGPSFREGFSPTTGAYVGNRAQLVSQLSKASDDATARNGIPHRYVPVDLRDKEACGITDEAVYQNEKLQSDREQGLVQ